MPSERMDILFLTPFPASPPTFGAQRRMEGLMKVLARRHRVACASLVGAGFDRAECQAALRTYCDDVVLVPARPDRGAARRLSQLRSLASPRSFERHQATVPALQGALDDLLARRAFDAVVVEFPFLCHYRVRRAPPGAPLPRVVVDEHNIEHDLARQSIGATRSLLRRLHHGVNWRKILREELRAWRDSDGVCFTSDDDAARARALLPSIAAAVVPNAVDVELFCPAPELPPPDGRTAVFFGTLDYFPNLDGVRHLLANVWPRLARTHPRARLKIIGARPPCDVLRHQSDRVEVTGLVDDVRPHLASASAVIVPLRVGGGTRFKILEAMAMGRPVVSTTLGAEGIAAVPGRHLLVADDDAAFAAAVGRLLDDAELGGRLGAEARALAEERYSWGASGATFERFLADRVLPVPATGVARRV